MQDGGAEGERDEAAGGAMADRPCSGAGRRAAAPRVPAAATAPVARVALDGLGAAEEEVARAERRDDVVVRGEDDRSIPGSA